MRYETVPASITTVPRPLPHQMPVLMWGVANNNQLQAIENIGFTYQLVYPSNDTPGQWKIEVSERLTGQRILKSFLVK